MRRLKLLVVLMVLVLGILAFTITAEAADSENGVVRFFRALFRFPAKTAEKSVAVVTEATKQGAAIGTGAIENVGEALTGSKEAAVGIVKDPIVGAVTTTAEAAKGSVLAPVEAAKESIE